MEGIFIKITGYGIDDSSPFNADYWRDVDTVSTVFA